PVLREEIADTWIHGIGTDPKKVAMIKELDRLSQTWDKEGLWENNSNPLADGRLPRAAFLEELLLVSEHTWGMDTKKFLADFVNWSRADFDLARRRDTLKDSYGLGTAYESAFVFGKREFEALKPKNLNWEQRSYSIFEKSHQEQRDLIKKAVEILPQPLRMQAEEKLEKFNKAAVAGVTGEYAKTSAVQMGGYVGMHEDDDIILRSPTGQLLRMGLPIYQEVGLDAYDRLEKHYLWHVEKNTDWAIPDNKKPGAENSDAPRPDIIHKPNLELSAQQDGAWYLEGRFDERPQMLAGCPEGFRLSLKPYDEGIKVSLFLYNKPANRKPEAIFLPFGRESAAKLCLKKMGQWLDADHCIPGGNQRVHGVEDFKWQEKKDGIQVTCLHTPLLAISQPKLLEFEGVSAYDRVYVNLYNNLWGTNFKMWYEEDIFCEFLIQEI
ncbi:MAG: DUF5054 domain-containing protein, partial [Clostridiales bacterium]|nr:DUF5054 domain-containing protein [Clostridiales bacterium]